MDLFTSDEGLLQQISETLVQCGCCARCVLRYLGVKDMYSYRGDTQEIRDIVTKFKAPNLPVKEVSNFVEEEKSKSENENKPISGNGVATTELDVTKLNGERLEADKTELESQCTDFSSKERHSCTTDSESMEQDSHTDVNSEVTNSKHESLESENCSRENYISCIVCLGILDEFTSDMFLQKVKTEAKENGFEFTNYICSLMTPVCVILREHGLMLYLKEKYEEVYGNRKYTDIATVKDVWKWRNGPSLNNVLGAPFDMKSPFDITLTFQYKESDKECSFLLSSDSDTFRKRKRDKRLRRKSAFTLYNRANVAKAVEDMSETEFRKNYQCPPLPPSCKTVCDIKCQNEVVFVAGRYNKYSRFLSQTPWLIDGVRKSESSVEELLCMEINNHFKQTEQKFSSSGREDVDVLMLGNGRPFVLELVNPRKRDFTQDQMTEMQKVTNAGTHDIQCRDLQIVTREETENLKEGEIDKVKRYTALCWSKQPVAEEQLQKLTELKELKILQKTPVRVLHRRPLATRDKIIHSMGVEKVDAHHFRVEMSTQAGTYIKEFVHGDFGRTKPNFSTILGVDCDILELDVMAVELDWPKKIDIP